MTLTPQQKSDFINYTEDYGLPYNGTKPTYSVILNPRLQIARIESNDRHKVIVEALRGDYNISESLADVNLTDDYTKLQTGALENPVVLATDTSLTVDFGEIDENTNIVEAVDMVETLAYTIHSGIQRNMDLSQPFDSNMFCSIEDSHDVLQEFGVITPILSDEELFDLESELQQ